MLYRLFGMIAETFARIAEFFFRLADRFRPKGTPSTQLMIEMAHEQKKEFEERVRRN